MDIVYHDIDLDFSDNDSMVSVRIKQNDDRGRVIRVKCYNNGIPYDVSASLPTLYASTDGVITAMDMLLSIDTQGRVIVPITAAISAIAGVGHCEIRFNTNVGSSAELGIVHSARFNLLIGAASADSSMPVVVPTSNVIEELNEVSRQCGNDIKNLVELEHFRDTRIYYYVVADSETSSLMGNPPKITLQSSDYDPDSDWLFMFKNDYIFVAKDAYLLDTEMIPNAVRILFNTSKITFTIGDSLDVLIFKPVITGGNRTAGEAIQSLSGTQTGYSAGVMYPVNEGG